MLTLFPDRPSMASRILVFPVGSGSGSRIISEPTAGPSLSSTSSFSRRPSPSSGFGFCQPPFKFHRQSLASVFVVSMPIVAVRTRYYDHIQKTRNYQGIPEASTISSPYVAHSCLSYLVSFVPHHVSPTSPIIITIYNKINPIKVNVAQITKLY